MKKLLYTIILILSFAACTKDSIELETGDEISMSPIADNITKAAQSGGYPQDWHIAVWSYLGSAAASDSPDRVVNYAHFDYPYFSGQEFHYKTDKTAWGGLNEAYFWPGHGSLVFAGVSLPAPAEENAPSNLAWNIEYEFYNYPAEGTTETLNAGLVDKFTITNYTQSANTAETFDLMWFGVTASSYNYRTTGTPVDIKFNHALTWITFKVYGDGAPAADGTAWKVTNLTLKDVYTKGNVVCTGINASWDVQETELNQSDMIVFSGEYPLTTTAAEIENTRKGTLVIPQKPVELEVTFLSGGSTTTKTVNLKITDNENDAANVWQPGTHYIYTLVFKANEILVSPFFGVWGESPDNTVTVQ